MKNTLQKIHTFFVKLPIVWFILIIIALDFLISFSILFVLYEIIKIHKPNSYAYSYFLQFPYWLLLIILLPTAFIETIIYQWFVIKLLRSFNYFKNKIIIIVLISAFLFGISHFNSLIHQISTFFSGTVLAYSFIVAEEKKVSPILIVTIIHFMINIILFSIINLFK